MVNSLERFRATFTRNGKRTTFTKKENKQFHASFIPKNNIIVLDSFYLLTFYFEKISNWIWRLPFAIKKKWPQSQPFLWSAPRPSGLLEKTLENDREIFNLHFLLYFFLGDSFVLFLFVDLWLNFWDHVKKVPEISYSILCCVIESKSEELNSMDRLTAI